MTKFNDGIPVGSRFTSRLVRTDTSAFLDVDINGYGVPPVTGTPNISFTVTLRRAPVDLVAPCQVWLRATGHIGARGFNNSPISEPAGDTHVYDPTQCELTHIWFMPDEGYTPYNSVNIPTAWRERTVVYGKQICHVFTAAGDKEVTCFCFDSQGNWGFASYRFGTGGASGAIISPDTLFGALSTISLRVDSSGTFAGATAGSTQVTGVANLRAAMLTMWSAGRRNIRIELRAGDVFIDPVNMFENLGSTSNSNPRDNHKGTYITRFGTGANPIIRIATRDITILTDTDRADMRQTIMTNVDIEGPYDPEIENGRPISTALGSIGVACMLYHRGRISGLGQGWNWGTDADLGAVTLSDVRLDGFSNYAVNGFTDCRSPIAILDCEIMQKANALHGIDQWAVGSQEDTQFGNRHFVRTGNHHELFFARTYFRAKGGWSNNSNRAATAFPPTNEQGLRLLANFGGDGAFYTKRSMSGIDRVVIEGGQSPFGYGPSQNPFLPIANLMADKVLVVASAASQTGLFGTSCPAVTMRNIYLFRHNIGPQGGNTVDRDMSASQLHSNGITTRNVAGRGPVRFINCTSLNNAPSSLLVGFTNAFFVDPAYDPGSGVFNSVQSVPSRSIDLPSPTALGTSPLAGFVCGYGGLRWNFPPIGTAGGANPATVGSLRQNETGTAGDVLPGQWMKIAWPNYTGLCNGAGMADVRAAVLANSTQNHAVSIHVSGQRNIGWVLLGPLKGGATFDTSDATGLRIRNDSALTWPSAGRAWILLDLKDALMPAKAGTSTAGVVLPAPRPLATSSALSTGNTIPRSLDDFFGTRKPGSRLNTGAIVPGLASQGAFEP